jgi:methylmalonyl-CoA mutase
MDNPEKTGKNGGLLTEFPCVSTSEWEAKITEDLKGADYEKKLIWKTAEGFSIALLSVGSITRRIPLCQGQQDSR